MPTETVYGLGANALDKEAVTNVYKAKGRPMDNPLIVHLAKADDAEKYAHTSELYYKLAERFMPGPLTVILPKKDVIPYEVTCGLETVAIRVPSNGIAHTLIELSGCPIAAPSANLSGRPSPTSFEHVIEDMNGRVDAIIDGGRCDVGVESTVIILKDNSAEILRPGLITYEELREVIPNVTVNEAVKNQCTSSKPASPGMKYRHYAPKTHCKLVYSSNNKKLVNERYKSLYIHNKTDIKIEAKEICELLNKKPGKFLKEIFHDLEYKLVNKLLENEKEVLKKYIVENY